MKVVAIPKAQQCTHLLNRAGWPMNEALCVLVNVTYLLYDEWWRAFDAQTNEVR